MKGTLFSADFVKDSNGELRLLELNTDTGFIDQELVNFDFSNFLAVLSSNNITTLDIIYKPLLHIDFVNKLSQEINNNLPSVSTINLHDENLNSIYPTSVVDTGNNFILRLAYDESAIFDSTYCKNRLNVYNLYTENSITDSCVSYYHSSSLGTFDTLTKEINNLNVPDVTVKDINETFNPIDFYKISSFEGNTNEEKWDNFISQNAADDKLIEQYHFHSSSVDQNGHVTSIRFFGIVYGGNLDVLPLHSYKISSIFELPTTIDLEVGTNKVKDHHYYEYTTNFIKNDSAGILSSHEVLMNDDSWKEISLVQIGDPIKSYYVSGSPQAESDLNSLTWNYDGGEFPSGSYITTSDVVFKEAQQLKYGAMMEMVVDNDSLFSGINKKYLVYDSLTDKSSFKFISEINAVTDYLYDLDGNLIQVDELNFYVSSQTDLTFVELDVEDTDTYIINGSTAFNSVVSHNSPCFVAGTKIQMEDGTTKNIEDVIVGESILSFDLEKNETKVSKVLNLFSKKIDKIVIYEFDNGGTLKATIDHPIFVNGKGWCSYDNLLSNTLYNIGDSIQKIEIGDSVKLINGNVILEKITVVEEETKVYNLSEVEINHNYFANDVLVHNRACFVKGTLIDMGDGTQKPIEDIVNGDIVVSLNLETGLKENQTVTNVITPIHDDLVKYTFENGSEIVCTFDHPFFVNGLNLASYNPVLTNERYSFDKNVSKIELGDTVTLINGWNTRIVGIEELEIKPTQTYIFEVSNNHNFFVQGILTHNKACFVGGTKVLMGDGKDKNIEDVQVGDLVMSYNEILNIVEEREVTNINSPIHDDLVEYTLSDGTKITSTFDHPYYVEGLKLASYKPKWTNERYNFSFEVNQIKVGDKLMKPNREKLEIISIDELERINTQTYIISVMDNQNFYANGVLVHNK
jgi:intein/homing endonuclease